MRMWMVDPSILCTNHLLGEHLECHMFAGTMRKGISLAGYVQNNLVELKSLSSRHDALVAEMENRGMRHHSPLEVPKEILNWYIAVSGDAVVNKNRSLGDLLDRCPKCRERMKNQ